jgi:hypothetical protein
MVARRRVAPDRRLLGRPAVVSGGASCAHRESRRRPRRCELHKAYIGFVERGERNVSLVNLRLIAKVVRVRLSDLLTGLG